MSDPILFWTLFAVIAANVVISSAPLSARIGKPGGSPPTASKLNSYLDSTN